MCAAVASFLSRCDDILSLTHFANDRGGNFIDNAPIRNYSPHRLIIDLAHSVIPSRVRANVETDMRLDNETGRRRGWAGGRERGRM